LALAPYCGANGLNQAMIEPRLKLAQEDKEAVRRFDLRFRRESRAERGPHTGRTHDHCVEIPALLKRDPLPG